jgi:RNA polymerase sigma-70 factor (ECF subfamily)
MAAMTAVEPPGDAELVAAYRAGDDRAATELVRRHAPALARYVHSVGAGPSEVDDVVQETFFRAFRRLDTWRGEASLRGWLCTIGANLVRDEFRRQRGRQVVSIDDRDLPDRADPHAEATAAEAEERLRAGLGTLPRLQREVFLLRAQQGIDYEQIARTLGTTPGAARVHYHHAVRRLKELVS